MARAKAGLHCRVGHFTLLGPPHPSCQGENERNKRHTQTMIFDLILLLFTNQERRAATQI